MSDYCLRFNAAVIEVNELEKRIKELEEGIQEARDIWHDGDAFPDAESAGNKVDGILAKLLSKTGEVSDG